MERSEKERMVKAGRSHRVLNFQKLIHSIEIRNVYMRIGSVQVLCPSRQALLRIHRQMKPSQRNELRFSGTGPLFSHDLANRNHIFFQKLADLRIEAFWLNKFLAD